jgi:hypothetical protein
MRETRCATSDTADSHLHSHLHSLTLALCYLSTYSHSHLSASLQEYTECPQRLLQGRSAAVYWFMIDNGVVSGGAGGSIPSACSALPGFHIAAQWAEIVHPSGYIYGWEGQQERARQVWTRPCPPRTRRTLFCPLMCCLQSALLEEFV